MKKALVVALLVMGLGVLCISGAQAANLPPWYDCQVTATGCNAAGVMTVTLTNPAFPTGSQGANTTVFLIDNSGGHAKEMFAAALTAFANSSTVLVNTVGITDLSTVTTVMPEK